MCGKRLPGDYACTKRVLQRGNSNGYTACSLPTGAIVQVSRSNTDSIQIPEGSIAQSRNMDTASLLRFPQWRRFQPPCALPVHPSSNVIPPQIVPQSRSRKSILFGPDGFVPRDSLEMSHLKAASAMLPRAPDGRQGELGEFQPL